MAIVRERKHFLKLSSWKIYDLKYFKESDFDIDIEQRQASVKRGGGEPKGRADAKPYKIKVFWTKMTKEIF